MFIPEIGRVSFYSKGHSSIVKDSKTKDARRRNIQKENFYKYGMFKKVLKIKQTT